MNTDFTLDLPNEFLRDIMNDTLTAVGADSHPLLRSTVADIRTRARALDPSGRRLWRFVSNQKTTSAGNRQAAIRNMPSAIRASVAPEPTLHLSTEANID